MYKSHTAIYNSVVENHAAEIFCEYSDTMYDYVCLLFSPTVIILGMGSSYT